MSAQPVALVIGQRVKIVGTPEDVGAPAKAKGRRGIIASIIRVDGKDMGAEVTFERPICGHKQWAFQPDHLEVLS